MIIYCSIIYFTYEPLDCIFNFITAHSFCLACILQWSEVASSCPMCKTTFESLIHDVKASNDYKIVSSGSNVHKLLNVILHCCPRCQLNPNFQAKTSRST